MSVIMLAATYLVYTCMFKVRWHTVSCRHLKICIVWTLLKSFRLGDTCMVSFACHDDSVLSRQKHTNGS